MTTGTCTVPDTFRCGHPRVPSNIRYNRSRGTVRATCETCMRARGRARHEATYQPILCAGCHEVLGPGRYGGFHPRCEPLTCICGPAAKPSLVWDDTYGQGECTVCRRPVLALMWHARWANRPTRKGQRG